MDAHELIIHTTSYHFDREAGYNERNTGLAIKAPFGEYFVQAGGYHNSYYKDSLYAGLGKEAHMFGPFYGRLQAGLVSGYDAFLTPYVLPEVVVKAGKYRGIFGVFPNLTLGSRQITGLVILSMSREF